MKHILITMFLLMGAMNISAQGVAERCKDERYNAQIRKKFQSDYSMLDYSTNRIDAKIMGARLTKIFEDITDCFPI